ncbi:hypothetical protein GKC49_03425 [Pantoea agglomerans]|uniref:Uncharacterized protein n=1 Tax=Enterobacter agglomerans TaxID=549 RepID=A0A7X2MJ68_ENTAG|nr:hypothetical protein [Pantoea agglomerans]
MEDSIFTIPQREQISIELKKKADLLRLLKTMGLIMNTGSTLSEFTLLICHY